ncbi:sugar transferase [Clostridium butyricum]|uniref:sugar transferase n=1 Tax=Clostridium butyricum TaxID=1492 RepID=UPI00325AAB9A
MQELNLDNNRIMLEKKKLSRNTYEFLKRLMDIICSMSALIVLAPILIVVAILIKIESKGPVIFSQERVGINNKKFKMYKFRSMVVNAEDMKEKLEKQNERKGPMFKIKNDPRITTIGRFIRKTSIDELPQLINILKGEMSIVGPRPSLPKEVIQFEPWMLERLKVKPGLTCYWQVSGRSSIGFEEWMELDCKYVKDRSILVDLKLIFKTFFVLFGDEDAC